MKCVVDISIEHKGGLRKGSGRGLARIWAEDGERRTEREQPVIVRVDDETLNALAIRTVNAALQCFKKPGTEIEIRMDVPYVKANMQYLEAWHEKGFRNTRGKEIANREEWEKLWMVSKMYSLSFEARDEAV